MNLVIPTLHGRTKHLRKFTILSPDHRRYIRIVVNRKLWREDRRFRASILMKARGLLRNVSR